MNTLKFGLGRIVMTDGIETLLATHEADIGVLSLLLARHQTGDWGDLDDEDTRENDLSVKDGFHILSSYRLDHEKVWVMTEADRSVTTVLLPSEY
jgi:hypothetical protein